MLPVEALAGRFRRSPRARRRSTWMGAALVAVGVGCGLVADTLPPAGFAAYERALPAAAITGRDLIAPSPQGPTALIIGGAMLAVAGFVLLIPGLIGAIARAGSRLPLLARLAVRDAERHRHRTGPVTTAITIVVTCSVALAFLLAGSFHAEDLHRQPALPPNTLAVTRGDASTSTMLRGATLAAAQLPRGQRFTLSVPRPAANERWPTGPGGGFTVLSVIRQDSSCPPDLSDQVCSSFAISPGGPIAIGGENAVTRLIAGPGFNAAARHALADGKVLVFDATMLDRTGNVHVAAPRRELRLPGHLVASARTYGLFPSALVAARVARAQGWALRSDSALITYGAHASPDEVDAALTAVDQTGAAATRDTGSQKPRNLVLGLTAAVAAFITLVGVVISVALSVAEGRADLATLAAVGAPPGRRRALMASQALLVGGLGIALGVGLGTFIAYTARTTTGSQDFVIPWANLAATAIGVPLLAAAVAGLCTRARMPMVRRTE